MNDVKYGIIGAGMAWQFHRAGCKNNPKIKFVSVYDIDEKKAKRTAKSFKMEVYSNLDAFFKSEIDAVLIMVPQRHPSIWHMKRGLRYTYGWMKHVPGTREPVLRPGNSPNRESPIP